MYDFLKTLLCTYFVILGLVHTAKAQNIVDFTLIDVNTQKELVSLSDRDVLELADLTTGSLDIKAMSSPAQLGRVEFRFNGVFIGSDNSAPYTLRGITEGIGWIPSEGAHILEAIPYQDSIGGTPGTAFTAFFEIVNPPPPQFQGEVEGFLLNNEDNGSIIQPLRDGDIIGLFALPTLDISIQAQVDVNQVKSVQYALVQIPELGQEGIRQNTIIDAGDEFKMSWIPSAGSYELTAIPFSEEFGEGERGTPSKISFEVIQQAEEIVSQVQLRDVNNNFVLAPITENTVLNLNGLPAQSFNIQAITEGFEAQSLQFDLIGPDSIFRRDNTIPYTLIAGQFENDFFSWVPQVGKYTLTITPYFGDNAPGTPQVFQITFTDETVVSEVILINSQNNLPLAGVGEGDILDLEDFSTQSFNLEASVDPYVVGSVSFILEGPDKISRIDNRPPYTLIADITDEDFFSWTPKRGSYTLNIVTHTLDFGQGKSSDTLKIPFTIKEGGAYYFGTVVGYELIDADLDQVIRTFDVRDVIVLPFLNNPNINLRAITEPANVGSVRFRLSGAESLNIIDNNAPYALLRDNAGNYLPWQPQVGEYTLVATPYSEKGASGLLGKSLETQFVVTESIGEVVRLDLMNASTDRPIGILKDGDVLNLSTLPTKNLNIRATPEQPFNSSVVFELSGSDDELNVENFAPFSLFGDNSNNNFFGREMLPGKYTLRATPYTKVNGGGDAGKSNIIEFEIVEDTISCENVGLDPNQKPEIIGELREWHKVTLTFDGPCACEADPINPFLDYWMEVVFVSPNGTDIYRVPGFFAADGDAANTHKSCGNKWRVHFAPDTTGVWSYVALFRAGSGVSISDDPSSIGEVAAFNGARGTFEVAATNKRIPDNRARGRLEYVGKTYLQFAGNKEYFLKGGPDSPENFLAYEDFDNTPNNKGYRKNWAPHRRDWKEGDPYWLGTNGQKLGKGIIGAINYLSREKELNVFSFLTLSMRGESRSDDDNVFPYIRPNGNNQFPPRERLRFDVSKLAQWEVVFEHADKLGLYLHFKMQEIENNKLLDQGNLGPERKIYIRELIARFAHHLALNWNIGEENNQDTKQRQDMIAYVRQVNPYKKAHIVLHTQTTRLHFYDPHLGNASALTGASFQRCYSNVHEDIKIWLKKAQDAGKPWVIASDEQGPATVGVPPDGTNATPSQGDIRKYALWGSLMAGGAGIEYYFGYDVPCTDLTCQDYRTRNNVWDQTVYALDFFRRFLPYWQMKNADELISRSVPKDYCRNPLPNSVPKNEVNYCFAREGSIYVVYLGNGGSTSLNLRNYAGTYDIRYYNPRTGQFQSGTDVINFNSGRITVRAPGNQDWVMLITRRGSNNNSNTNSLEYEPIKLFPNPGSDVMNLEVEMASDCPEGSVVLYNQEGMEVVNEKVFSLKAGQNAIQLAIDKLPNGFYLYRITTCEDVKDGRFFVSHE